MPVINVTLNSSSGGASASSFQGDWNANTNTPTLANTDTSKDGYMYKVSTGGSTDFGAGSITFEAGDIVINNGSVWSRIDATDAVLSVNGNTGVVVLDKMDVGLPNVDNTSDANKPVSSATQTALDGKVDIDGAKVLSDNNYTTTEKNKLAGIASGAQVNTVTSVASKTGAVSLVKADVGLSNVDNTADTAKPVSTAQQTALNLKANLASPTFTGTVNGITKSMVGLGNVDNTSDANKPISSATQTALNGKANSSHTHTESEITDLDKYTQAETDALLSDKVDVDGAKVLSANDFTDVLKTKLDNIEANADVTDATNVDAAGAVMNSDTSTASMSFVVDEDDFNSDSATKVPTQQSTKAYVDAKILTLKIESDESVGGVTEYSADLGNLALPVGTYSYRGSLTLYSSDYQNRGLRCDVYNSGGGTTEADGFYECKGANMVSTGTSLSGVKYSQINGNAKIADMVIPSGAFTSFYGKLEVEGMITVTSAEATISIKIGKSNAGSSTVTIYKGSKIDFIKQ